MTKSKFYYVGPPPSMESARVYYQTGAKSGAFQGKGFDGNPNSTLIITKPGVGKKKSYGRARK